MGMYMGGGGGGGGGAGGVEGETQDEDDEDDDDLDPEDDGDGEGEGQQMYEGAWLPGAARGRLHGGGGGVFYGLCRCMGRAGVAYEYLRSGPKMLPQGLQGSALA